MPGERRNYTSERLTYLNKALNFSASRRLNFALSNIDQQDVRIDGLIKELAILADSIDTEKERKILDCIAEIELVAVLWSRGISAVKLPNSQELSPDFKASVKGKTFQVEVVQPREKKDIERLRLFSDALIRQIEQVSVGLSFLIQVTNDIGKDITVRDLNQFATFIKEIKESSQGRSNTDFALATIQLEESNLVIKTSVLSTQLAVAMSDLSDFRNLFPADKTVAFQATLSRGEHCLIIFDKPQSQNNLLNGIQRKVRYPQSKNKLPRIVAANVTQVPNAFEVLSGLMDQYTSPTNNWALVAGCLMYITHVDFQGKVHGYSYEYWRNPKVNEKLELPELEEVLKR